MNRRSGWRQRAVTAAPLLLLLSAAVADVAGPDAGASTAAVVVTGSGGPSTDVPTARALAVPGSSAPGAQARAHEANKTPRVLRVCADPNNLPFSNARGEGFENRIAALLADELGATVEYTWWAQRRGFIRNTLSARRCDVVMGLPQRFEMALTTAPYYRSSYVFVHRADRQPAITSFDDPLLRELRIGVQLTGDDYTNTPPAHALGRRQIVANVVGYPVYGDYREENPPARIISALARGEIDVAVVWGPLGGYFASRQGEPLVVTPVTPQRETAFLPMSFAISLGVRKGEHAFKAELEHALERRRAEIQQVLAAFGVPHVEQDTVAGSPP